MAEPRPAPQAAAPAGAEEFDAEMQALRVRYVEELAVHARALDLDWQSAQEPARRNAALLALLARVHRLAGSGTLFDFEAISDTAGALEAELRLALAWPQVEDDGLASIGSSLQRLRSAVAAAL
jgi:hypothetical protein